MARFIVGRGESPMRRERLLAAANLEFAVPLAVEQMREMPGPARQRIAAGFVLDAGSWVALRAWEDSAGLTALARGLAALAYRPGGVAYLGMRWSAGESGQAAA